MPRRRHIDKLYRKASDATDLYRAGQRDEAIAQSKRADREKVEALQKTEEALSRVLAGNR